MTILCGAVMGGVAAISADGLRMKGDIATSTKARKIIPIGADIAVALAGDTRTGNLIQRLDVTPHDVWAFCDALREAMARDGYEASAGDGAVGARAWGFSLLYLQHGRLWQIDSDWCCLEVKDGEYVTGGCGDVVGLGAMDAVFHRSADLLQSPSAVELVEVGVDVASRRHALCGGERLTVYSARSTSPRISSALGLVWSS